ncbi:hypothetical protein C3943_04150 [Lysinibacillus sp. B2A1]|nr:hypothetical protein C3943_04150 [Lysinibacillus sp. B2A1]
MLEIDSKKKVGIWGTGQLMKRFFHLVKPYNPQFILDNNSQIWGKMLYQLKIRKPQRKSDFGEEVFIIIASSYYNEISQQLIKLGFEKDIDFIRIEDLINYNNEVKVPNGHYYSPIPDMRSLFFEKSTLYPKSKNLSGINLNLEEQEQFTKKLLENIKLFNESIFKRYKTPNGFFNFGDGLVTYSILKTFKPKNIIEVGSGYSSALLLDCIDELKLKTELTFIEPYPERLKMLLFDKDLTENKLIKNEIQSVPFQKFKILSAGDILFIDSSHVSKINSDVNYLFFEILPNLKKGVIIHIHDIFKGFEYPREFLYDNGFFWNEAYLLRAFLQFNDAFKILYWNDSNFSMNKLLLDKYGLSGGSIWLQKVQ